MRKRAAAEFHRLDAHQTRKQHGEEKRPHLRLKLHFNGRNKSKVPPSPPRNRTTGPNVDESERTGAPPREKAPERNDGEAEGKTADLRLTLLGLGCLRRDIVARMMTVGSLMMMRRRRNGGDGG